MNENFKIAVADALKELLESKHLFQSVYVKTEHLLKEVPKKKRISKKLPPEMRLVISVGAEFPRRAAEIENHFIAFEFMQPLNFCGPKVGSQPDENGSLVLLPKICISCVHCDAIKPPHLPFLEGQTYAPLIYSESKMSEKLVQVFAIPYRCQNCELEPVNFFVRRVGLKLTLIGRSHFEPTAVPASIPKPLREFYSEAIIAFKTNHCLAALFYLRTVIEQHMRNVVKPAQRISGEELADEYQKRLSEDFPKRFSSFKRIYQDLSAAMHEAREDGELFLKSVSEIEGHFQAVALFTDK